MRMRDHIIVALAVAIMFGLGAWQLGIRAPQKEALIAAYDRATDLPPVDYPFGSDEPPLYRQSRITCEKVTGWREAIGENRVGTSGWAHIATCENDDREFAVETGWSRDPNAGREWEGGDVTGILTPDRDLGVRLVSNEGLGGLEASAPPTTDSIPNNHRSYAFQWFAFAFIAAIIYLLALRKRMREERGE